MLERLTRWAAGSRRLDVTGTRLALLWSLRRSGAPMGLAHLVLLPHRPGRGFRIGRGSCVIARESRIGRDVHIGSNTNIVAQSIDLGDGVRIGDGTTIRCKELVMRRGARIDDATTVYGIATPASKLHMDEFAWIYSHCHINTDEAVTFGARSAAGSYSLIFTHSSYLPMTAGYPVSFAPVAVGSDVWLPWHVFIMPGVHIGDGATIGAFAVVASDVPANSLAAGVPARVIKDAQTFRRSYDADAMAKVGLRIVRHVLECVTAGFVPRHLFAPPNRRLEELGDGVWRIREDGSHVDVVYVPVAGDQRCGCDEEALFVTTAARPSEAQNWIDIVSQASSLSSPTALMREVVSKFSLYGIRAAWHEDSAA